MADGITRDDIRAAVASGSLTEAQAAGLISLADQRQGHRANMAGDDEPFELFKGFSEIFVTVGLVLLMSGFMGLFAIFENFIVIAPGALVLSWVFALYFTKKRRMSLPSIALAIFFATNIWFLTVGGLADDPDDPDVWHIAVLSLVGMVGMALYFGVFRLPFSMFLFGLFGLLGIMAVANMVSGDDMSPQLFNLADQFFDLRDSPVFALATLIFGCLAMAGAMWFDLRDPHRVSRYSATAFWLHLLAAPALVNTMLLTVYNLGGPMGMVLTIGALFLFTLLALIIDRRSFLTVGLIYMGTIMTTAFGGAGHEASDILTLLVLGVFVTWLGASWTQVRGWLLDVLPDFPGKNRLPPYVINESVGEVA